MNARARGADFSSYQDRSHLERAAKGIDFAFVKATEGIGYKSPAYGWQVATLKRKPTLPVVGVYHFLAAGTDGVSQWDFFEDNANLHLGPVAVDYEAAGVTDAIARAFIARGRQRGFKVGLYGSAGVARKRLGQAWTWAAWWSQKPPPFKWQVWQFAAGEHGDPDWNVFNGDRARLIQWARTVTAPVPKPAPARWWLRDPRGHTAVGPLHTAAVAPRLAAYLARHPGSRLLLLERR